MDQTIRRRWSDNDKHLGPLTFAYSKTYRPLACILSSGDSDERGGCCVRLSAFGGTAICELPPVIKPWRKWVDLSGREWAKSGGYWDEHPREYGFSLTDGFLHVSLGRQTHDSSTTQDWSWFLPWTQWRQVAHRLYNADGSLAGDFAGNDWERLRKGQAAVSKVGFVIADFDGQEITVETYIEEREWRLGTGMFRWLGYLAPKKRRRSLDMSFASEVGREKGSWKGGMTGTGAEMSAGEMHEGAMRRFCEEEHRSKSGRYTIKFLRYTEESCPGHIASDDPKVCRRCGVHIDSFRPDDAEGELH